ncbi:helix-turn-helix domain-containing protein [Flavobacterium sp. TMP13]|uniref:helix-turn-helix domain-containing protein n=1 Tax=Flavobacterium sp. TMP13 TaxID=3425950 RepID=UPI003D789708
MIQKKYILLLFCAVQLFHAQKITFHIPDSLKSKNYNYLDEKIYALKGDSTKASVYLYAYLNRAKNEQNWKELVNGYQNILHESPDYLRITYADSMVYSAKNSKKNDLIGYAYLSKGIVYYGRNELQIALDNYIVANSYISKTDDDYLIYKVKYNIAIIKTYLGFYDEAISLFKECITYFKDNSTRPYLNSLHSLGLCYNRIGNYGLCSQTNKLGLLEGIRLQNREMDFYFIESEGVNQYFLDNYNSAIKNLEKVLPIMVKNKDYASEAIANFYIGKSYWKLNKHEKSIRYFKKVDQIFTKKKYSNPELREVYELMIKFYKSQNNLEGQLYCIDQLIQVDQLLKDRFTYLLTKIHKEYDTNSLLFEKDKINTQLLQEKENVQYSIILVLLLLLFSVYLTYRHFKNRKVYKKNFSELMLQLNLEVDLKTKIKSGREQIEDISPETANNILKQLERFESEQKFLLENLTLSKLAVQFNSNPRYLSVIISHYRGKTFSTYINDLKIDFLIQVLKTNKKVREYTNGALAEEVGFSTTQRFTRAFYSRTQMPILYFIEQIKKNNYNHE